MTPIINGIPIRVRIDSKDIRTSMISFDDTGPSIILENKRITGKSSTNERISYSVKTEEESSILPITSKDWVYLEPIFMTKRFFSKKPHQVDDMYPKSSDGWLSHLTYDGIAVYIVAQEIENDKKFLLSFYDAKSGEVYKSLKVNNYEVAILRQLDDFSVHEQIIEQNPDADRKYLESILDDDPPSWNQIAKLVEGVTIPGLQQKENMRETVAQLVPSSFPDEIREEVMAFLAWSINARIPNEDPIDYGDRFLTVRIFRSLVIGHLQCMIDNQKPPHYVRIMAMAERESLSPPKWPMTVPAEQSPWLKAYYSLIEAFPNWLGRVVEYTKVLNQEKKIALQNPVTKSMARKSKTAWGERFSLYVNSIIMRSEINNNALGLKYLIYLGGAHKWPHNHLSWSARLGQPGPQARQIQVMLMPIQAASIFTETGSNIKGISWSTRRLNFNLFDDKKREWRMSTSRLHRAISGSRTMSQMKKEFTSFQPTSNHVTNNECRILDLVSWGMYLSNFESEKISAFIGMDMKEISKTLNSLYERNLIDPYYMVPFQGVSSVLVEVHGPPKKVLSTCRAFLKHTPSTTAYISDKSESGYLLSRLPESNAYDIMTSTPEIAEAEGIRYNCYPIRAYNGYQNNLYSRLYTKDGIWDSDVSGLLNQMSPR